MKRIYPFAFWFMVGYHVVTKAAPILQAKVEAMDLDRMWEIWNDDSDDDYSWEESNDG